MTEKFDDLDPGIIKSATEVQEALNHLYQSHDTRLLFASFLGAASHAGNVLYRAKYLTAEDIASCVASALSRMLADDGTPVKVLYKDDDKTHSVQ